MIARAALRLVSVANQREHWSKRAKRAREHRFVGAALARNAGAPKLALVVYDVVVTITRIAPRALDSDNMQAAAKACRDGIADALGVPDNDPRIAWRYAQRKGKPREYGVEIEIEQATSPRGSVLR